MDAEAVLYQREDLCAVDAECGVAFEVGFGKLAVDGRCGLLRTALPGGAGAGLLFFLGGFEAGHIEFETGVAGCIDHKVQRHTEGFVELERLGAQQRRSLPPLRCIIRRACSLHESDDWRICELDLGCDQCLEVTEADLEHTRELLFFREDNLSDAIGCVSELRIGNLHLVADGEDHLEHEGLFLPQQAAVADASAEDFTQDVATAFVRGLDSV